MAKRRGEIVGLMLLLAAGLPGASAWAARQLHVDDDNGTSKQNGTTVSPFKRIAAAVAAAASGDTIRVAAGVYRENVRVSGKVVLLLGGYAGGTAAGYAAGVAGDFSTLEAGTHRARIDGSAAADAALRLSEAGETLVEGFAITGGRGWRSESYAFGGGVYVDGGAPTLRNNLVEGNKASTAGGGIHLTGTRATVVDNVIRGNEAEKGGGVSIDGGNVTLRGNLIRDNVAFGDHGGGLIASGPALEIVDNQFVGNTVGRAVGYGWGGALLVHAAGTRAHLARNVVTENYAPSAGSGEFIDDGAEALIENELIYRNRCPADGGAALYVDGLDESGPGSTVTLLHVTVADHRCDLKLGDGLYVEHKSRAVVRNSIFAGQGRDFFADASSTIELSATRSGSAQPGPGNLTQDCLFANPAAGDYHLRSKRGRWEQRPGSAPRWVRDTQHSPCIDAAAEAAPFAGETMPNGGRANLGAEGNTEQASLSNDGTAGGPDAAVAEPYDGGGGAGDRWRDAGVGPKPRPDGGQGRPAPSRGSKSGCALAVAAERSGGRAAADLFWLAFAVLALGRRRQARRAASARGSTARAMSSASRSSSPSASA